MFAVLAIGRDVKVLGRSASTHRDAPPVGRREYGEGMAKQRELSREELLGDAASGRRNAERIRARGGSEEAAAFWESFAIEKEAEALATA